jgi:hypothetical protein
MWTLPFVKNKPLQDEVNRSNGNHSLIQLRNVSKNYKTATGDFPALKGVDLDMQAVFVSVIGKSGSANPPAQHDHHHRWRRKWLSTIQPCIH